MVLELWDTPLCGVYFWRKTFGGFGGYPPLYKISLVPYMTMSWHTSSTGQKVQATFEALLPNCLLPETWSAAVMKLGSGLHLVKKLDSGFHLLQKLDSEFHLLQKLDSEFHSYHWKIHILDSGGPGRFAIFCWDPARPLPNFSFSLFFSTQRLLSQIFK